MASSEESPAKKRKLALDNVTIASRLYEPPIKHPVTDLYDPERVKITVSNQASSDTAKMSFTVPKALICNRSEYFEKVFKKDFVEGRTGAVELDDVDTWTFQCFVNWLYYHRIFIKPANQSTGGSSAMQHERQEPHNAVTDHITVRRDADASAGHPIDANAMDVDDEGNTGVGSDTQPTSADWQERLGRADLPTATPTRCSSSRDITGDPNDAITWPWQVLFKLYVFADKYSTRQFRMVILDRIQVKFLIRVKNPHSYPPPSVEEYNFAAENLAPSSPLFRFLADIFGLSTCVPFLTPTPDPADQAKMYSELHGEFLAASLARLQRHNDAKMCPECRAGRPHQEARFHSRGEAFLPLSPRELCASYHKHGEDEEEAAHCVLHWQSRTTTPGRPPAANGQGNEGQPR